MKTETRNNAYNKDIIPKNNKSYKQKKKSLRADASKVVTMVNHKKIEKHIQPLVSNLTTLDYYFEDVSYLITHPDTRNYKDRLICLLQQSKEKLNLNSDELTKQHIYSNLRQVSSQHFDVVTNMDNSPKVNIYNMTLSPYIIPYILTILYPNIFENIDNIQGNIFLSSYGAYIFGSFKLLEAALILDGFLMSIDNYCRQIIEAKKIKSFKEVISYFTEIYKYLDTYKNDDIKYNTNNHWCLERFFAIYLYFIQYSRDVWCGESINKKEKTERNISIINTRFFLNNKKGLNRYNNMCASLSSLRKNYHNLKNNNLFSDCEKILFLFTLNRSTHLFDFNYHNAFHDIDFHITEGFATNLVLYTLLENNKSILSAEMPKDINEEAQLIKTYYTEDASEFSLCNNLSLTDLAFLRNLIKRISLSLDNYDFRVSEDQAWHYWVSLDNYYKEGMCNFILNSIEIPETLENLDKSSYSYGYKYYQKIYNDLYSYYNIFFEQDD